MEWQNKSLLLNELQAFFWVLAVKVRFCIVYQRVVEDGRVHQTSFLQAPPISNRWTDGKSEGIPGPRPVTVKMENQRNEGSYNQALRLHRFPRLKRNIQPQGRGHRMPESRIQPIHLGSYSSGATRAHRKRGAYSGGNQIGSGDAANNLLIPQQCSNCTNDERILK